MAVHQPHNHHPPPPPPSTAPTKGASLGLCESLCSGLVTVGTAGMSLKLDQWDVISLPCIIVINVHPVDDCPVVTSDTIWDLETLGRMPVEEPGSVATQNCSLTWRLRTQNTHPLLSCQSQNLMPVTSAERFPVLLCFVCVSAPIS